MTSRAKVHLIVSIVSILLAFCVFISSIVSYRYTKKEFPVFNTLIVKYNSSKYDPFQYAQRIYFNNSNIANMIDKNLTQDQPVLTAPNITLNAQNVTGNRVSCSNFSTNQLSGNISGNVYTNNLSPVSAVNNVVVYENLQAGNFSVMQNLTNSQLINVTSNVDTNNIQARNLIVNGNSNVTNLNSSNHDAGNSYISTQNLNFATIQTDQLYINNVQWNQTTIINNQSSTQSEISIQTQDLNIINSNNLTISNLSSPNGNITIQGNTTIDTWNNSQDININGNVTIQSLECQNILSQEANIMNIQTQNLNVNENMSLDSIQFNGINVSNQDITLSGNITIGDSENGSISFQNGQIQSNNSLEISFQSLSSTIINSNTSYFLANVNTTNTNISNLTVQNLLSSTNITSSNLIVTNLTGNSLLCHGTIVFRTMNVGNGAIQVYSSALFNDTVTVFRVGQVAGQPICPYFCFTGGEIVKEYCPYFTNEEEN